MATLTSRSPSDPFSDPAGSGDDTLTLDRDVTLTLNPDHLTIYDEGFRHHRTPRTCCGLLPHLAKTTRSIPYHHILWADFTHSLDLTIQHAQSTSSANPSSRGKHCTVAYIHYTLSDKTQHSTARAWIERLLRLAYPPRTQRRKRVKVLINPFGGQGYAQKIWTRDAAPIFAAARMEVDVEMTRTRGHAVEIARGLDIDAYDAVVCASGDGLPHEVFNGLAGHREARRALRKVAVVQLPCGSGNALSLNLNGTGSPSWAAVEIVKGVRTQMDLVALTQGEKTIYSFLSQAVGIIAETDLGTESLRWMGSFRFTWGILVRLLGKVIYPAEVSMVVQTKNKKEIVDSYYEARRRVESAEPRHMRQESIAGSIAENHSNALPALRYGTVNDELHRDFVTFDLPRLGNFYAGNACWMAPDAPFFAAALPSDGLMDVMMVDGSISRRRALQMVLQVENGTMLNFPDVDYRKVVAYRITPRKYHAPPREKFWSRCVQWLGGAGKQTEGLISIDGESVPWEPFQAEIVPGLATVLCKHSGVYEFDGPKDI